MADPSLNRSNDYVLSSAPQSSGEAVFTSCDEVQQKASLGGTSTVRPDQEICSSHISPLHAGEGSQGGENSRLLQQRQESSSSPCDPSDTTCSRIVSSRPSLDWIRSEHVEETERADNTLEPGRASRIHASDCDSAEGSSLRHMAAASTDALRAPGHRERGARMSLDVRRGSKGLNDGSHLETMTTMASRRPDPLMPMAEPRSSTRVSFSLLRPAISAKEGGMRRSSLASLFSRSRENLQITTGDAGEEEIKSPRRLSEATLIAKSFMLKTFGGVGPNRHSFSNGKDLPSSQRPSTTYSREARGSSSWPNEEEQPSREAASQVFASAFGAPHSSALDEGRPDPPPYSSVRSVNNANSRPASLVSAATSFFSIQAGPNQGSTTSFTASPVRRQQPLPVDPPSSSSEVPSSPAGLFASTSSFQRLTQGAPHATMQLPSPDVGPFGEERSPSAPGPSSSRLGHDSTLQAATGRPSPPSSPRAASRSALGLEQGAEADHSKGKMRQSDSVAMRRGSSMGIDEEQDAIDRAQASSMTIGAQPTQQLHQQEQGATDASGDNGGTAGGANSGASRNRSARSSRLSHLPRLNSMRVEAGSGVGGMGGAGGAGDDRGDNNERRDDVNGPASAGGGEDYTSEEGTGDEAESRDEEEVETDTATDEDYDSFLSGSEDDLDGSMPGSMPTHERRPSRGLDHHRARSSRSSADASTTPATSAEGPSDAGISRSLKPEGIKLPPTPQFGNTSTATPDQGFHSQAIGKDSWTQFGASTPFESPLPTVTPRAGPMASTRVTATPRGGQTPKVGSSSEATAAAVARSDTGGESSYFNIHPVAPRLANGAASATNGDMPPPSPSIISRHRAPSSASTRSFRSIPMPTPNREIPQLPPVVPMKFSGKDRAKSPVPQPAAQANGMAPPSGSPDVRTKNQRPSTSLSSQDAEKRILSPLPAPGGSMRSSPSARPGLYQQQSRSLIDLSATAREVEKRQHEQQSTPALVAPHSAKVAHRELSPDVSDSALLIPPQSPGGLPRRRRSMFEVGAAPPPYSIIHRRPEGTQMIYPREEEGKEKLPIYNCSVHIEGYLPRKMEFSAPGIQAKDRSWRRLYFVLHGTSLRVYKSDLSGDSLAAKGAWGIMDGVHVHKEPMNEDGSTPAAASAPSSTANGTAPPSNTHHGLTAAVGAVSNLTSSLVHHPSTSSPSSSSLQPPKAGLIRNYTLQGAESGLAADYLKRRHVVRVRAEGEQFLLQTKSDRHVVDWIEAFQASTNVSLDLERRPMPKFITLPRRRRRRRPQEAAAAAGGAATTAGQSAGPRTAAEREAADLAEAQRRSMSDARGGTAAARNTGARRISPPRPLGLPGDDANSTPDPSAAFDEMLREEHEDMSRQDAGDI